MTFQFSRIRSPRRSLLALLLASTVFPMAGPALAQSVKPAPDAGQASAATHVAEVLITATKRSLPLQKVPVAVTALTGAVVTKMGGSDFADIAAAVPGLSFESDRAGENRTYIRGVAEVAGGAPTVGVYMDEIPITTFSGEQVNLKTFDIQRAEVLRGPQGTLYGEGSEGGTIRIVTNKPDASAFSGQIYALGSGTDRGGFNDEVDGMINAPLVADKLAVRAVALWSDYDGWITNPVIGRDHYNRNTDFTGRVAVRFTPDPNTTVDLGYMHQHAQSDGPSDGDAQYRDYAGTPEPRSDIFDIYSLTASHNFGFATLTSATGYFVRDSMSHNDFTSTAPLLSFFFGTPISTADILRPNNQRVTTEELRLVSNGVGPLAWTVGGFYKHDNLDISNATQTTPALPVTVFTLDVNDTSDQYAVFGEADYALTGALHLIGGLRYFDQTRSTTSAVDGLLPLILSGAGFNGLHQSAANSQVTPRLSLNYRLSDDALVYATYSGGFRAGDINPYAFMFPGAPNSFGPERLTNYELGAKTSWMDQRLVVNAAVFRIQWQNVIIDEAAPSALFGYSVNGGDAHSDGGELEVTAVPVTGLTLTFAGAYTEASIDKVSTAGFGVLAAPGATLPFVPKYKLFGSAEYDFPVLNGDWNARLRADVAYNGSNFSAVSDAPSTLNPAYTTVNLRAGLSRDKLDLTLFADNVGDVRGQLVTLDTGTGEATLIRPRTVGVSLSKRF
jgi:iron complex outermembrane receptor protein